MFQMWPFKSRTSRFVPRIIGVLGIALLSVFGSVVSSTRPALASGSGAYLYAHTATSANTSGDYTLIDNPVSNNNPNAIVFATANWNPGGTYTGFDNHQVGVWYDAFAGKWGIFNEDATAMPVGASFNVYVLPEAMSSSVFVQTVTTANTSGYITYLNSASLNGNPSANFLVTQNWNPGGSGGTINNHAIGVWYNSAAGQWTIYNEDRSALPIGTSFNVVSMVGVTNAMTQVATSSNTSGDSTCINSAASNGNPNELVFVTHIYSGYFTDVSAVWYNSSVQQWCIFDGSFLNMPVGASFFATPSAKYP